MKIYLEKRVENECVFRKGIECSKCGYCERNLEREMKRLTVYYDRELNMLFLEYLIPNNSDLNLGDVVELTFETPNDTDTYCYKIVKKQDDVLILAEYYSKYITIKESLVAFDHGVKLIDAVKNLGVIL